jgi:hypothetical protein
MSTQTATRDDAFMFDRSAETLSRDALTALQVERAKRTLEHAYANVVKVEIECPPETAHPSYFKKGQP